MASSGNDAESPCVGKVRAAIASHAMLHPGERVLVAVSGGADSVCLLDVLRTLGYEVEVAHLDHQTRGGDSAEDAAFVRRLAEEHGVPCHVESRPVESEARDAGQSFETHARAVRYAFLVWTAFEQRCAAIATGHHADDQAETILMRLLRGTTPNGLAGIPPVRMEEGVRIIRPLIECTRGEIVRHVEQGGLAYRTDATNADTQFTRNRIRHELLPLLACDFNPNVRDALLRLAEAERCDSACLDDLAETMLESCYRDDAGIDRHVFRSFHESIRRRIVLRLAWRHGVEPSYERVVEAARHVAEGGAGMSCEVGEGMSLVNGRDFTELLGAAPSEDPAEYPLEVPGETQIGEAVFAARYLDALPNEDLARYCHAGRQVFDADALGLPLVVRHRRPGDRFTPLGMAGSRKLQDYFVDRGVAVWKRDAQWILFGPRGIAWVVGHAIDARVAVTPRTTRLIEIEVRHAAP